MVSGDRAGGQPGGNGSKVESTNDEQNLSQPIGNANVSTNGASGPSGTGRPSKPANTGTGGKGGQRPDNASGSGNTDGRGDVSSQPDKLGSGKTGTKGKPGTDTAGGRNRPNGNTKPDEPATSHTKITRITEEEANDRELLARTLGKRSWTIANDGSEEVITAHGSGVSSLTKQPKE